MRQSAEPQDDRTSDRRVQARQPAVGCRFDPSGQFVFATAQDNTIQRWELATGKATPLVGHDSWVRALAFHPAGSTLYSGGYDGRVIWWDADGRSAAAAAHDRGPPRLGARGGRQPRRQAAGHLRQRQPGQALVRGRRHARWASCVGHANHVYNVAFHPDGGALVSGDLKGVVASGTWPAASNCGSSTPRRCASTTQGFGADIGGVRGMAFSADGKLLACGGITDVSNAFAGIGNPLVVLFDLETGEKQQQLVTAAKLKRRRSRNVRFHPRRFRDRRAAAATTAATCCSGSSTQPNEFFDFKLPDSCRDFDLHRRPAAAGHVARRQDAAAVADDGEEWAWRVVSRQNAASTTCGVRRSVDHAT